MENQENFYNKIKNFIIRHRLYALFIFTVMLFIIFLSLSSSKQSQRKQEQTGPSPSITRFPVTIPSENQTTNPYEDQILEPFEQRSDFQKKEISPDGYIIYYFTSINPNRPNITITSGNNVLMERRIFELEVSTSDYTGAYSQPEKSLDSSIFYGTRYRVNLYGSGGFAFIDNKDSGKVIEQITFKPQKVENFIDKFLKFL